MPRWGAAEGGAERLWSAGDAWGLAADGTADPGHRLEAEVGYGFAVLGGRAVATPWAGMTRAGSGETFRLCQRLKQGASEWSFQGASGDEGRTYSAPYGYRLGSALDLGFEAARHEAINDDAPAHERMPRARMRW